MCVISKPSIKVKLNLIRRNIIACAVVCRVKGPNAGGEAGRIKVHIQHKADIHTLAGNQRKRANTCYNKDITHSLVTILLGASFQQ